MSSEELSRLDRAFTRFVRPETFPIGIRMLKSGEMLPETAKQPNRDLGVRITTCMGYTMARRYGWLVAMSRDDISCPLSKVVYGFEEEVEYYREGCTCAGMYTESNEAGARTEASTAKFDWKRYQTIVCGPLSRCAFEPEVILIYGNSAQVMILVAAHLYRHGGRLTSSFAARIDCSDSVIETMRNGQPQVILPCYGDRVFGQTQDHEMGFSFLLRDGGEIVEGLEALHKGGVRYPIPTYLRFQPTYPPSYDKLEEIWAARSSQGVTDDH